MISRIKANGTGNVMSWAPIGIILVSVLTAVCLVSYGLFAAIGAFVGIGLLSYAAWQCQWYGVLAILPLAFAVRPAPPALEFPEAVFGGYLAFVCMRTTCLALSRGNFFHLIRAFRNPILFALALLLTNAITAFHNGIILGDWVRGLIPFLFLLVCIPFVEVVSEDNSRTIWFFVAFGALVSLLSLHVIFYYFSEALWRPYWIAYVDGLQLRFGDRSLVPDSVLPIGPRNDRITMFIPAATDALLPLGLVVGYFVMLSTRSNYLRLFSLMVSLLAITAIVFTYTRSMLLSPLLVMVMTLLGACLFRRDRLWYALVGFAVLLMWALFVIVSLDLEGIWLGRLAYLFGGLIRPASIIDVNVSTRLEEYRIAWSMFLEHPLMGNGLGAKHPMTFIGDEGQEIHQEVG